MVSEERGEVGTGVNKRRIEVGRIRECQSEILEPMEVEFQGGGSVVEELLIAMSPSTRILSEKGQHVPEEQGTHSKAGVISPCLKEVIIPCRSMNCSRFS